jgi:hypothetical protein
MEDTTMPTWYGWDEEYSWEINDDDDENPYLQMAKGGSTYAEGGGVSIDWEIDVYINFEDTGWIETINVVAKDKKEAIKKAKELATETVSMGNQDEQDATFRVDSIKSSTTNWKRYKDYAEGGDLFEHYERLPDNVQELYFSWGDRLADGAEYEDLKQMLLEFEELGYTFDYGLDAEPYDLRAIDNV